MAYEPFLRSCNRSVDFPKNLISCDLHAYDRESYFTRLQENQSRLFCEERKASVDIWDLGDAEKGMYLAHISFNRSRAKGPRAYGQSSIQRGMRQKRAANKEDFPICLLARVARPTMPFHVFVLTNSEMGSLLNCQESFIHAPHSRDKLNITKEMFVFALSYHQVMPAFLDLVLPFGRQVEQHDFHYSAFRSVDHLSESNKGFSLPKLGRSGITIQQSYNLKAVEPAKSNNEWPWSIRQTAIYHSFDLCTGRTVWVIVKGNQAMKKRMMAAQDALSPSGISPDRTTQEAFSLTLGLQLVSCEWARENWRWFINFLDENFQAATKGTATADVKSPPSIRARSLSPNGTSNFQRADTVSNPQYYSESS